MIRTQNDWKTVEELDVAIRKLDDQDPAKYDFALFWIRSNKRINIKIKEDEKI